MSKLENFISKTKADKPRRTINVTIGGYDWNVRKLLLTENRMCERLADRGDKFDWYKFNDARIIKATEHDFDWNNPDLLKAYGAGDKYELPALLFNDDPDGYHELLEAVRKVSAEVKSEGELVEVAKN